jgi:hypothetical protein
MNDEFYIGWEDKAAPGIGKRVRRTMLVLILLAMVVPVLLASSQRLIGVSVFEWGQVKQFSGILEINPYPHLLVPRPGKAGDAESFSSYYLVAPWKFGVDAAAIAPFDNRSVSLKGTLIYRAGQTMIEIQRGSIQSTSSASASEQVSRPMQLGRQTLIGEIVDSKCFLGVMNPGQLTPHRACAIRCISGGIPPVLLVRSKDGPVAYFLLVSADGKPVNQQVLDLVAEPVEISGEVERQGELLILRADPASYRRVTR